MASVWAVIEKDKKVLLVQRSLKSSRPSQWCFPGGGIHIGESPESACIREVAEEVGLRVAILESLLVAPEQQFFLCKAEPGQIQLKPNECQAFAWVEPGSILGTGEIMDLRRVIEVLKMLGYKPEVPENFRGSAS